MGLLQGLHRRVLALERRIGGVISGTISVGGGGGGSAITALTGDVTATGPGSVAANISADVVGNTELANMAQATFKMRAAGAGTGDPIDGTPDQASTALDTATDPFLRTSAAVAGSGINQLTGDVTAGPGTGSQAATIASDAVTNTKLANMAQATAKMRAAGAGTGDPIDGTPDQLSTMLDGASDPFVRTSALPGGGSPSGGDVVLLDTQTPSGTGVVTFSSLSTYTHLLIMYVARSTGAATSVAINLRINGDTGSNYDYQRSQFTTSANLTDGLAQTFIVLLNIPGSSSPSDYPGIGVIEIPDYRGTTFFKAVIGRAGGSFLAQTAGNVQSRLTSGWWRNTGAITSITLTLATGNYVAGSKFSLYGMN